MPFCHAIAALSLITLGMVGTAGCSHLEPRWLLRTLPGSYPDVVYFFPTRARLVALTIDDGPDPAATAQILGLLARHDARATFFFLTDNIAGNEALVSRTVAKGHELGNHLTEDEVSSRLPPEEFAEKLSRSAAILSAYAPVQWFRPGSAWYNDGMLEAIAPYGFRVAEASMPPLDARLRAPRLVAAYIDATVRPGSIIVLHTNRSRGLRALETLERVLPRLKARGFEIVSLGEMAKRTDGAALAHVLNPAGGHRAR